MAPPPANANLYAAFAEAFRRVPNQTAFQSPGVAPVTYGALHDKAERLAGAMVAAGIKPGDRVMVQAEKSIEQVVLYLATLKAGAVYNPLNTAYTPSELAHFIADAEPRLVVAPAARLAEIGTLAWHHGATGLWSLEADGSGELTERARASAPMASTCLREPDDLASLIYTSGTTGRSKGAMLSHGNLASNARTLLDIWGFVPGETLLHALPIYHVHGLFVALNTAFLNGSRMHWLDRFDVARVLTLLPDSDVMMGVPTFYTRLLAEPVFAADHCRRMRLFISGSAPLLAETHEAFTARTGHRILERYGMTETGMITSNPLTGERVAGSVGYALPGVAVRIGGPDGRELPRGEVGGVELNGPNVFQGYWRLPDKTRAEFRPDGYFITGDQGIMAPDGRLTLVGRAKDMIISGGLNVYPAEIEQELSTIAGIGEAAVVGVSHPDFGEAVIAVLTPVGANPPDEAAILARLSGRLAKFKQPKRIFMVAELPRNAMGKVQKAELRKVYGETFKGKS